MNLAEKQKRVLFWSSLTEELHESDLKKQLAELLRRYRALLANCWIAGAINSADKKSILSLERQLTQLSEEAHLLTRR